MLQRKILSGLIILLMSCSFISAAFSVDPESKDTPYIINVLRTPPKIDKVVLPLQSEINNALNKLGNKSNIPDSKRVSSTDSTKVSLNLGLVIADGMVSIKNKNKDKFQKSLELAYEYAKRLNMKDSILSMQDEIKNSLNKNDFKNIEIILNKMREQIAQEMNKTHRKEQSRMVYVSGWLEGLYIVTKTLEGNFTKQDSSFLKQHRKLINELFIHMNSLSTVTKNKKEIKDILAALPKIENIVKNTKLSKADMIELSKICLSIRNSILS